MKYVSIINMKNIKRWTIIFRVLSNVNRIKIIEMLLAGRKMNVSEIAKNLGVSFKSTSNHLSILKNLDVLESQGKDGHVFYYINSHMPKDFQHIIKSL